MTSTSTPKSRKVQFRNVVSGIQWNHSPIAHRYEQTRKQPDLGGLLKEENLDSTCVFQHKIKKCVVILQFEDSNAFQSNKT